MQYRWEYITLFGKQDDSVLNSYGEKGWELFAIAAPDRANFTYFFRRQIAIN